MKSFIILVGIYTFIEVGLGNVIEEPNTNEQDDRFFYFARDDDDTSPLQLIDSQEPVDEIFLQAYSANLQKHNTYFLYTRKNPFLPEILIFGDINRLLASNYDGQRNTVILCHGWNSNGQGVMSQSLRQVFLEDDDVNVIVLDWSSLSKRGYTTAKRGVPIVGSSLGFFITWLSAVSTSYDRMHLVGFSLGAHIIGLAGRQVRSRVRRITALDPAGPQWHRDVNRLAATDAVYVEVIHTNNLLGYPYPCGDADFYPNGGSIMPGCITSVCSHSKAHQYMFASVRHNHMKANECSSFQQATGLWRTCRGSTKLMGNSDLTKSRPGVFRITTRSRYPY